MSMKLEASARLLSEQSNQEKVLHYTKMLRRIQTRLLKLSPDQAPYTYNRFKARETRITKRIAKLKSRHRY